MPLLYYQDTARNGAQRENGARHYISPVKRFNSSKPIKQGAQR